MLTKTDITKRNQVEILELKSKTDEMKISLEGFNSIWIDRRNKQQT